jgi:hypothetical protein
VEGEALLKRSEKEQGGRQFIGRRETGQFVGRGGVRGSVENGIG